MTEIVPPNGRLESDTGTALEDSDFKPYVPPEKKVPEFTLKAIVLGVFFAILFGTSSVYLALCAGLTVGGSIPVAVLVIGIFKRFGKSTILENNLVQTIGSAGESVASLSVFTVITYIFLREGGYYFNYIQLATLAIIGGLLGILFMIPLRRSLIVKEHKTLRYPEGTACAEVLIAGEKQGDIAKPVFIGLFTAGAYWLLMKLVGLWKEIPYVLRRTAQEFYPNATLTMNVTPEYLGIGYIIGPRVTTQMLAGSLFAWLVLIPLFSKFPQLALWLKAKDVHSTLIDLGLSTGGMQGLPTTAEIHAAYVKYIAVGAVVGAGLITLLKTSPIIIDSFRNVVDSLRGRRIQTQKRTEKDLPLWLVLPGAIILALLVGILPHLPGKFPSSLVLSLLVVIFGFFFVAVSSRFVGVAGYTVEPVTPMVFTTVMVSCLIFVLLGWTSDNYQVMVVPIAAAVCIAAGNAGATSQDLKTGFLIGSTPRRQQLGLLIGVILSGLVVGGTILLVDRSIPHVPHAIGYIAPGQDAPKFGAPQASLLSMLIKAVLGGKMAWGLVLLGIGLAVIVELSGAMALSVAAGMYLPLSTITAIFAGSMVRWLATRKSNQGSLPKKESELSKGMLYATGLVAGGALTGMIIGFFQGFLPDIAKKVDLGKEYWKAINPWGEYLALLAFVLLGLTLYRYAKKER